MAKFRWRRMWDWLVRTEATAAFADLLWSKGWIGGVVSIMVAIGGGVASWPWKVLAPFLLLAFVLLASGIVLWILRRRDKKLDERTPLDAREREFDPLGVLCVPEIQFQRDHGSREKPLSFLLFIVTEHELKVSSISGQVNLFGEPCGPHIADYSLRTPTHRTHIYILTLRQQVSEPTNDVLLQLEGRDNLIFEFGQLNVSIETANTKRLRLPIPHRVVFWKGPQGYRSESLLL